MLYNKTDTCYSKDLENKFTVKEVYRYVVIYTILLVNNIPNFSDKTRLVNDIKS